MTRRRRWIIVLLCAVTLLTAAIAVSYLIALPWVIRRQVRETFARLGLDPVEFELRGSSLWRTELVNLSAGDALRFGSLEIRYSPLEAARGRLRTIRISDAQLGVDLGAASSGASKGSSAGATIDFQLPFERIDIVSSRFVLRDGAAERSLPVEGSLVVGADRVAMLKLVSTLAGAPLTIDGRIDPRTDSLDLAAGADGIDLASLVPLLPAAARAVVQEASGRLDARLRASHSANETRASLELATEGARLVTSPDFGLDAEGVSARVVFDDLLAPSTARRQVVRAERLMIFDNETRDVVIELHLAGPRELRVSEARLIFAGGLLSAEPFTIDPRAPVVDTIVSARKLELGELVTQFSERARASGSVSGSAPVRIDWTAQSPDGAPSIHVGAGSFATDQPGNIRVGADPADLAALLEQADPRFGTDPGLRELRDDVVEAMRDFDYDALKLSVSRGADGQAVVSMRIHGHGRSGSRIPINFGFNVTGIEQGLRAYLRVWSRVLRGGS